MTTKITTVHELLPALSKRRQEGNKIVFTNGCFDLLHIGHTRYLQEARRLGDLLIVGLNSDASVRSLNKDSNRPIVPEDQRAEILSALTCVDFVVLFDEVDPLALIQTLRPDVLVKGGDWTLDRIIGREEVEAQGGSVHCIPLTPGISTTHLIQRIVSIQASTSQRACSHEPSQGNDTPPAFGNVS